MRDQALRRHAGRPEPLAAARARSGSWRASTGRRPSTARSRPRGAGWSGRSAGPMWWAVLVTVTTRAALGAQQRRQQLRGEREVAEVVDAELHLEAVLGLPLRHRHQAGVVDEDVDRRVARRGSASAAVAHRGQGAEVERHDLRARRLRVASRGCSLCAAAAFAWSRAAITTWAPAPASARAVSRPRPPLAPVTTATRPRGRGCRQPSRSCLSCVVNECSFTVGDGRPPANSGMQSAPGSLRRPGADAGAVSYTRWWRRSPRRRSTSLPGASWCRR